MRVRPTVSAVFILLISAGLRIAFIDRRSLWFDEGSSWLTAHFGPADLLNSLRQSTHVPLYYPVLRAWMILFGESPVVLRSMSVFFGLLTVMACGLLGKAIAPVDTIPQRQRLQAARWFGLFCAALCGCNAFQVWSSVEARMYSLGTLLTVLSTFATLTVAAHPNDLRRWLALVGLTMACVYAHHFLALTSLVQAAWLIWSIRRPSASDGLSVEVRSRVQSVATRYWMISVLVVGVLWVPGLALWSVQLQRVHHDFWIEPMSLWSVLETCCDFFLSPPPGRRWEFHWLGLSSAGLLLWLMLRLVRTMQASVALLWFQSIVPIGLIALVSLHTPLWESRYFRFAHVSLLVCVAMSLWTLSSNQKTRFAVCLLSLGVSIGASVASWDLRNVPGRQAVRGAMLQIAKADPNAEMAVVVCSPMDFIVARCYAQHLNWSDERVKLWAGFQKLPEGAVHLITANDWWDPDINPGDQESVWLLGSGDRASSIFSSLPPGEHELKFPSDTWLDHWTVHLTRTDLAMLKKIQGSH